MSGEIVLQHIFYCLMSIIKIKIRRKQTVVQITFVYTVRDLTPYFTLKQSFVRMLFAEVLSDINHFRRLEPGGDLFFPCH